MKKHINSIAKIGLAFYLALLFAIVMPNHHHQDNTEHADCVVCIIANQPALVAIAIALAIIVSLLIIRFVLPVTIFFCQTPVSFQSRAPPLL